MCSPTEIVPMRRKHHSPPARYLRVVKFVVVFSAALTLLTLLDRRSVSQSETPGETSQRFLKEKGETEHNVSIDEFDWSETTEAFLPVLTKYAFKLYVDTFRDALFCFHENGLYLIPTGGTLVGTLRHKGMIPWDDDIDTYYFVKDAEAIMDHHGPIAQCLRKKGIVNRYYRGNGDSSRKNIRFVKHGKHLLSAFPAHTRKHHIDFVSQNIEKKRSPMQRGDIFPMTKYPFHDYYVYLPRNIKKYIQVDWGHNQVDKIKTPTYKSLMSTAISGHLHRGCHREAVKANITDIEFLKYYDPANYLHSLPFRPGRCHGRLLRDYVEYVQKARRLEAAGGE